MLRRIITRLVGLRRSLVSAMGLCSNAIARDPGQSISTLPMLSDQECLELLEDRNKTAIVYLDRNRCLHHIFEEHTNRTPERVAVIFEHQRLAYGELNRRGNQLAHYLKGVGVGPDVLVGLLSSDQPTSLWPCSEF